MLELLPELLADNESPTSSVLLAVGETQEAQGGAGRVRCVIFFGSRSYPLVRWLKSIHLFNGAPFYCEEMDSEGKEVSPTAGHGPFFVDCSSRPRVWTDLC